MKKISTLVFSLVAGAFMLQSCEDFDDNAVPVSDFIWKGLNLFYLYQENIPELDDNRFANQEELNKYLETYSTQENLFEDLLYRRDDAGNRIDRWSVIYSDYRVLENVLQGVSKSTGAEFVLSYTDASQTNVFGYVRYVLPNTDAADKGVKRGDIFYAVNGTPLTPANYQSLLSQDSYTLNLADYNSGSITPNGREIALTKYEYGENPVHVATTYTTGSHKIGYLMYNGFYSPYDNVLNNTFAQFSSEGVTDLVLDLRYNGGGSIRTATYLASMITGQFNGQLFAREQWNSKLERYYNNNNSLSNLFTDRLSNGSGISSLNLNKVYIVTSGNTASASELLINCLEPYIDVVVVGATTTGKNVGSITLYDSRNFSANGRTNAHRYAMQPIVLKVVNKEGFGDYSQGITADIQISERLADLGTLGDPSERLFAAAISNIVASGRRSGIEEADFKELDNSKKMRPFGTEMYKEDIPEGALGLLKNLK